VFKEIEKGGKKRKQKWLMGENIAEFNSKRYLYIRKHIIKKRTQKADIFTWSWSISMCSVKVQEKKGRKNSTQISLNLCPSMQ